MGKDIEAFVGVGPAETVVYQADNSSNEDVKNGSSGSSQYSEEIPGRSQIGVASAVFLIFNRMIGTGIFATPSTILSLSGSVGMSL